MILLTNQESEWVRSILRKEPLTEHQELYRMVEQRTYASIGVLYIVIGYILPIIRSDFSRSMTIFIFRILLILYLIAFVYGFFKSFGKKGSMKVISPIFYFLSIVAMLY